MDSAVRVDPQDFVVQFWDAKTITPTYSRRTFEVLCTRPFTKREAQRLYEMGRMGPIGQRGLCSAQEQTDSGAYRRTFTIWTDSGD